MNDEQQLDETLALWVDKLMATKGKASQEMPLSDEQRVALALHRAIRPEEELSSAFRARLGQRLDREFEARKPKGASRPLFYQRMAQRPLQAAAAAVLAFVLVLGMALVFLNPTVQSESSSGSALGLSEGLVAVLILGLVLLVFYGVASRFRR